MNRKRITYSIIVIISAILGIMFSDVILNTLFTNWLSTTLTIVAFAYFYELISMSEHEVELEKLENKNIEQKAKMKIELDKLTLDLATEENKNKQEILTDKIIQLEKRLSSDE